MTQPQRNTAGRRRGRQPAEAAEHTRQAILTTALSLFADRGYAAVSLRDIAEGADVTHGLIRHHFGTKQQVWQAVLDHADRAWLAAMRPAVQSAARSEDPATALEQLLRALIQAAARHPHHIRLLLGEGIQGGPRLQQILQRMAPLRVTLSGLLARLQARGYLTALDPDAFLLLLLLAGAAPFGLAALTETVTGRDPQAPATAEQHADYLARTLLPHARR